MSTKVLPRRLLLGGAALLAALTVSFAQDGPPQETNQPSTPARPIILPMTPGNSLNKQQPKPPSPKARLITAPAAPAGATKTAGDLPAGVTAAPGSGYTFCNRTSYSAEIAIGIRNGGLWLTRGWWPVSAGVCKTVVTGPLKLPTYYIFARTSFAHTGPSYTWGGVHTLCISGGERWQTTTNGECAAADQEPQGYARIDTDGKSTWTTTLNEDKNFKTMEQARVAGLQRLLYDLARFEGPIDGAASPRFAEALTAARTELAVGQSDTAGLYSKLLEAAKQMQTAGGLTFCNRTQEVIWAALGQNYEGKKESKGWWRLQPGQCAKVIKDRLEGRTMYAFGIPDGPERPGQNWGGTETFCTRKTTFEIAGVTDCAGRGSADTGFGKIESVGRPGAIYEFVPRRAEIQR